MTLRTLFRLALVLTVIAFLVGVVQDRSSASLSPAADLEAPSTKLGQDPENNRLIVGLEAYRAGQLADAIDLLHEPVAAMDDWRLMILAESTSSLENFQDANTALESLTRRHPDSPIRGLAIQRAAQIATEYEQWDLALQWIEFARSQTLAEEQSREIETLAWEIGITLERPEIQSQAGRRLLVEHPLDAVELDVEAFFRKASGSMDWASLFTPTELERRASRQVDGRKQKEALATLELIAPDQRSFDWSLLRAEALTRKYQGREALEVLESLNSSETERRVAIAWQRALAARDASRVRRGRNNLVRSQREEMKVLARDSLDEVARLTPEQSLKTRALKLQFALISDEEDSFEASMAVLRRLQTLDTEDTTGTRHLWRLGWQAYTKRDLPVAIGYWSELESMYPDTTSARSGRYWTGRSHEAMGHNDRALTIYGEILAGGTDDFYSRHARDRVEQDTPEASTPPSHPTEPWPEDPALARAQWLSELGLDEFALHELEAQQSVADRKAFCAEKAKILARLDQRRESISNLACAFPALGKAHQGIVPKDALELYYPLDFRPIIEQRAGEQSLSPHLVFAMVRQESAFDSQARSWAGARGLMQLMPATGREVAQRLGLRYSTSRLNDPDFSVRLGTRYFRQVLDMFDGNVELALAGYNGGPYRIKKLWRQAGTQPELDRFVEGLSLEETKTYVKRIILFEDSYEKLYNEEG